MGQISFSDAEFTTKWEKTRREVFLEAIKRADVPPFDGYRKPTQSTVARLATDRIPTAITAQERQIFPR